MYMLSRQVAETAVARRRPKAGCGLAIEAAILYYTIL